MKLMINHSGSRLPKYTCSSSREVPRTSCSILHRLGILSEQRKVGFLTGTVGQPGGSLFSSQRGYSSTDRERVSSFALLSPTSAVSSAFHCSNGTAAAIS